MVSWETHSELMGKNAALTTGECDQPEWDHFFTFLEVPRLSSSTFHYASE